ALAEITVGRGRGGLGSAVVLSTLFFHGISGSSTADTAAIAKVTLDNLRAQRYPLSFSTALLASAGATATLIPPTIDLILIGVVANISIAGLFAAGIIPALINGLGLILYVLYISRKRGYGVGGARLHWREMAIAFIKAIPALLMVVIILGGILGGVFTPTEASAVAVVYGFFVSMVVYRDLTVAMLPKVFIEAVTISGIVLFVIAMSATVGYAMTISQAPQAVAAWLGTFAGNKIAFLLMVQIVFLAIGMFMDAVPALIILMPILVPVAAAEGINPIHFGILVEVNVALGMAHPPVGVCLYAACAVARIPMERVVRPMLPMMAVLIFTMLVITYDEDLSMWLPRLLGFDR
ncbi:MAG: TRAP transporter large permease, partial [Acetobacteraceae bacterium]|nr:TRAP transporter large permease [Acetobacteraceae bacterium]